MHSHRKGGEQPPIASLASESVSLAAEAQVTPSPLADDSRSVQDALPASHLIEVQRALADHDVVALRALSSRPGGFLTSELRKRAWPLLLRSNAKGKGREDDAATWDLCALPVRDDERQVRLDIDRSLVNFPHDVRDDDRDRLRVKLEHAILTVLRRHPALHYFQGYHDIVSVLLLTLEEDDLVTAAAEKLSLHVVRDSMGPGLEPTLGYLKIVHRLVKAIDSDLYQVVSQAASMPFFALSWALTLFSHDLDSVATLARLFDFLLSHNPSMICHLVVALLLFKKDDLLAVSGACDGDPAMVHSALSQLPHVHLGSGAVAPVDPVTPPAIERSSTRRSRTPSSSSSNSSPTRHRSGKLDSHREDLSEANDSEDLMSSASFMASSSDLARSPTLTASSSVSTFDLRDQTDDLDASVISASEIEIGDAYEHGGLRQRRRHASDSSKREASSSALATTFANGYDADVDLSRGIDDDDSLHTLDESMFGDPDIEGLAFEPFPTASSLARRIPVTPPSPDSRTSRSGHVVVSASEAPDSPGHLPPKRTVDVDELIARALELAERFPIVLPSATGGECLSDSVPAAEADASTVLGASSSRRDLSRAELADQVAANRILGPNSCVFTWRRSINGTLTDGDAEEIVRLGEGIVFPEALGPDLDDPVLADGADETSSDEVGDADSEEYDIVPSPGEERDDSTVAAKRRSGRGKKKRRSSSALGRLPPMLALGPHGWLVVSGVAVAAVAYGVYRQQGSVATAGAGTGLGTAGLGLGLGGFGGAPVIQDGARGAADSAVGVDGLAEGIRRLV